MPEITTTTAAVREALNIGIGKAETLTPETILLKQMTQDGKDGNLQQALGVGREYGRSRMRRQINKTITDTEMKIGNMTVEDQKTDAGTTKDQLSEFLQKGYDKNSHQAIRERVEDIVDSRWPGLTAAQKTRAAEDLLRDPSLRGLLLQEIDGVNGETEFSGDPGRLTAEKTKLEKPIPKPNLHSKPKEKQRNKPKKNGTNIILMIKNSKKVQMATN